MRTNEKIARAVATILGTHAAIAAAADQPAGNETGAGIASIQEVVVTAQRRSENVQDVPIAIQAFSGEALQQLNVTTFEDLIKHLPNVSGASQGPGQVQIFMRGLSAGSVPSQSGGSINGFPNVALYLDEQSGQLPGRNLDVYAADLERIEVLAGPQGTLFGAGAQAGVIRYITNKPKLDKTEASVTAGYGTTAGGDPNTDLTAMINLPLIADTLAVRAVIYNDRRGGYINNVPGTFTRKATDGGIGFANYPTGCGANSPAPGGPPCQVPPNSPVINNYLLTGNAINPVSYQGLRVSALWQINDNWNALLTQSYQNMDAQGVFYQMPTSSDGAPLPPQSVTLFNPSDNKDRFENTAWTFNGRVGVLKAVYTGSYLVRNVETVQDYTNYARGLYADYYQCHGADPQNPQNHLVSTCYTPSTTWTEILRNTHQSQELRLSTPDDWRVRAIFGGFWENLRIYDQLNWNYKTLPPCVETQAGAPSTSVGCLTNIGPTLLPTPSSLNNPDPIRGDNVGFFNDVKRGYTQRAFFTSVDFDIIPKVLTITAGTRYYHFDNEEKGAVAASFAGCYEAGQPPCTNGATNIDAENLKTTYTGFKSRANLTWHFMADGLVYYTWSQGFRPGAFNRTSGKYIPYTVALPTPQYISPLAYESDNLTNNEIGWKTEWLDHRLQWNGAVYQEDWKNAQVTFFQPGLLGNIGFNANGPDYRIRGLETSFIAVITRGLTAEGGASWVSSQQTNSPYLIANNPDLLKNPASAGQYQQPIIYGVDHSGTYGKIPNPYGPVGDPAAFAPPLQFNALLRYQWVVSSYEWFAQAGVTHTAHSFTQSGSQPPPSGATFTTNYLRFENPAYTSYDASIGVGKGAWSAKVYAQNLTNVLASTFTSNSQFALQQTILRPRVVGLQFGYRF
ncbi:MAG: TonB-dependent receptor plug domain-containing protein [Gammaproteobacteria bacterium]|nr:TonB-dependent receptor plug domain-containing protein [Gammaproteobacteria bacterium]